MAKQLLLNVLVQVLGDFIEGITEENLKVTKEPQSNITISTNCIHMFMKGRSVVWKN
jgi:hypothetical protein